MAFVPLAVIPIQLQDSVTSENMSGGSLDFFLAATTTETNLYSDNVGTSIGTSIDLNSGGYPESGGNIITLFRDSSIALKIVGKDADGSTVFTSDQLEDALVLLSSVSNAKGASLIGVEDSSGHFSDSTVEDILADIGLNYLKNDQSETITATYTFESPGSLEMGDQEIVRPILKDYAVKNIILVQSGSTITLDMSLGNSFEVVLTDDVTIDITNPPATGEYGQLALKVIQDGSGGAYTITWPSSVVWPSATAPTMSITNNAIDEFTLRTTDEGTQYRGSFSQAFG